MTTSRRSPTGAGEALAATMAWLENVGIPYAVIGGVAVHGAPRVPNYPASHGCIRVVNPVMDLIWGQNLLREEEAKDWHARLDALKRFSESLTPYNTVGKLKNLRVTQEPRNPVAPVTRTFMRRPRDKPPAFAQ